MPLKIENCSMRDIETGNHSDFGENTIVIRLQDPDTEFKPTGRSFMKEHRFNFLDAEDATNCPQEHKFSENDAHEIVSILLDSLLNNHNVIVHCHAGICRSGAVTEIATMIGFEATRRQRIPNLRMKSMMMKELGFGY